MSLGHNWNGKCQTCGEFPTVILIADKGACLDDFTKDEDSDLCGPCFFGEADTVGGNW